MRYKRLDNEEIVKVRYNEAPYSIRITCCDCGLTHDVRIMKHGLLGEDELEMIFSRNRRSTSKERKERKKRVWAHSVSKDDEKWGI